MHLALDEDVIIPEVLSNTRLIHRLIRLMSARMAIPVLRASGSDHAAVATIGWLHRAHLPTTDFPPAFVDGGIASWPLLAWHAPLYFFPCLEQRGLLYLPLLFHEFGHILYAVHKPEQDNLVGELQQAVAARLLPASRRNDPHAAHQAAERQAIVDTWYGWAQELFCDALGFTVGGPCFLHAFASHLSRLEAGDYYQSPEVLRAGEHPVTMLRIQFLLRRARNSGFMKLADDVGAIWSVIGVGLGVIEDYHGFYMPSLDGPIEAILDDMLTVASPRPVTPQEAAGDGWDPATDSPVRLFNRAWSMKLALPETYDRWEQSEIVRWSTAGEDTV